MSDHAVLSPSKASRWIGCPGSVAACIGIPNTSSTYADEGTAAHAVAAARLLNQPEPAVADAQTSDYIDAYVNTVRNAATGKILLVEQRLNLERWTGEKGGKGTSDAVIIDLPNRFLEVWDLKFGMGHMVFAENNEQLMLYALGVLDLVEALYGPMEQIKLVISQPRRDHLSEFVISREDLIWFGQKARSAGELALSLVGKPDDEICMFLKPTEDACIFCPRKAICPALAKLVQDTVFEEFATVDPLPAESGARKITSGTVPTAGTLNLIGDWVAAKRAYIEEQLRAGLEVEGWKLVLGKKGNRKFSDLKQVEKLLKSLKFKKDQIYETSLIPLTKIEKIVPKPKWPVFEKLIVQADPVPIAVASSDKRPAYTSSLSAENFDNIEGEFDAFS